MIESKESEIKELKTKTDESKPKSFHPKTEMSSPLDRLLKKETEEAIYAMAYSFYTSGHYSQATHYFRYLTLLNPKSSRYWMGLGACYQRQKEYARAAESYTYAALFDEANPLTHFHASECLDRAGLHKAAEKALEAAAIVAKREPKKYQTLIEKIKLISLARKSTKKNKV